MPRKCSVCHDATVRTMAEAGIAQGEKLSELARRLNVGEDALRRHRKHMKPIPNDAAGLDEQLAAWTDRLSSLYQSASQNGDLRAMVEVAKSSLAILDQRQKLAEQRIAKQNELPEDHGPSLAWIDTIMRDTPTRNDLDFTVECPVCKRAGAPRERVQPTDSSPQVTQ